MADVTISSAVLDADGLLTVTGSNFTQTTTTVTVDGTDLGYSYVSATELTVSGVAADAAEVTVSKNGISATADITAEGAELMPSDAGTAPEVLEGETPVESAITAGTWPNPIDGFRAAVAGVALVGLIPVGDEKTPYPTGTQLGAGKKFWLQNGYYKSATPT